MKKANKSNSRKASADSKNAPPSRELERNEREMKERLREDARGTRQAVRRGAEDAGVAPPAEFHRGSKQGRGRTA